MQNKHQAGILVFVVTVLSGCITGHGAPKPGDDAALDDMGADDAPLTMPAPKPPPAQITSVKDWDDIDPELRQEMVEGEIHRYPNLSLTPPTRVERITQPAQKAFVEKMAAYMRANGDMTVEDASHAQVGTVTITAQVLMLGGKDILGGSIAFEQQGCDLPDESAPQFKTAAAAENAGCDLSVGGWRAEGAFNHTGVPFEHGDYMEWTGQDATAP